MTTMPFKARSGRAAERSAENIGYTGAAAASKDRPPTILQLVPRLDQGGVERGALEIVEAIRDAGGQALVATAGGRLAPRVTRAGGEIVPMSADSKNPLTLWRNAHILRRLIRARGVDIVHARSRAPAWSGYWAARSTGTPFVTTFHGAYAESNRFKRAYNAIMARGRPVIAISEFIRDLVRERYGVPDDRIVTIPRGVDVSMFAEEGVGNERLIELIGRWGLIDDPRRIILMPGRLTRWKGGESLIDAAARLKEIRGPDFVVLMVGDEGGGGFGAHLRRRIERIGVGDVVSLTGGTEDMVAAYKISSVVVSASIEPEAFGRVIIEAQAMSRPVAAADHGGARETVSKGISGWLYPPGDAEALARILHRALEMDPSERARMGLAGRARVHSTYTVGAMQRATIGVYEQVVGRTFRAPI